MTTDEERRVVARRLRGISEDIKDWSGVDVRWYISKAVFGDVAVRSNNELLEILAYLIEPSCDRDELLALADEMRRHVAMDEQSRCHRWVSPEEAVAYADRIREALGVTS